MTATKKTKTEAKTAEVPWNAKAGKTPRKDVVLDPAADLQVNATKLRIMTIATRNDGQWVVRGRLLCSSPERNAAGDKTVSLREAYDVKVQVRVMVSEVAAAAGIAEEDVSTSLTLAQVYGHVEDIAVAKTCAAMGLTPPA